MTKRKLNEDLRIQPDNIFSLSNLTQKNII